MVPLDQSRLNCGGRAYIFKNLRLGGYACGLHDRCARRPPNSISAYGMGSYGLNQAGIAGGGGQLQRH